MARTLHVDNSKLMCLVRSFSPVIRLHRDLIPLNIFWLARPKNGYRVNRLQPSLSPIMPTPSLNTSRYRTAVSRPKPPPPSPLVSVLDLLLSAGAGHRGSNRSPPPAPFLYARSNSPPILFTDRCWQPLVFPSIFSMPGATRHVMKEHAAAPSPETHQRVAAWCQKQRRSRVLQILIAPSYVQFPLPCRIKQNKKKSS